MNFVRHQQTTDDLPHPPETDQNDMRVVILHKRRFTCSRFGIIVTARQNHIDALHQQRRGHHGKGDHHQQQRHLMIRNHTAGQRCREQHERKFPALTEHPGKLQAPAAAAGQICQQIQHRHFDTHQHNHTQQNLRQILPQHTDIQRHTDRNEEHSQQQPFKRLNGDLQLMAVFRIRQHHPCDKCSERHGKPELLHKHC